MKKIITLFLFVACSHAYAQRFDWATSGGYTGINNSFNGAIDIATDQHGNIYTMDIANGQQQCQGVTADPYSSSTTFIYKFDSIGVLEHISRVGAFDGGTFTAFNIETDEEGNLYLLGQPNGVNEVVVNDETITAVPHTNILIKMDESGKYLWSVNTGFAGNGEGSMLQYHNGYLYFQSGNLSLKKADTEGNISDISITASYYSSPTASIGLNYKGSAVFNNGDLLFAAYTWGTVAFGTDTLYHIGNPFLTGPILLMRCDTGLNLIWAKYLSNARDPDKNFLPVATDDDDNIYTTVQVNYEMIVGTDTINNPENVFIGIGAVAKTDPNGNDLWAKRIDDHGKAIAWDILKSNNGNDIIIGGGFTGNAQIGPFTLNNGTNSKPFIASINSAGTFINAFNFLEEPTGSDVNCLADGRNGNYITGGKLLNFGTPELSCIPIESEAGFYLGRFNENPATVPVPVITVSNMIITAQPPFSGEKQWFLNNNAISGATGQTYTASEAGNYHVVYSYSDGCVGSESSNQVNFDPSGVDDLQQNDIAVYPNPSQGIFYINGLPHEHLSIEIRNLQGELIFKKETFEPDVMLDLSNQSSGVYFIHLITQKDTQKVKVIKQ